MKVVPLIHLTHFNISFDFHLMACMCKTQNENKFALFSTVVVMKYVVKADTCLIVTWVRSWRLRFQIGKQNC